MTGIAISPAPAAAPVASAPALTATPVAPVAGNEPAAPAAAPVDGIVVGSPAPAAPATSDTPWFASLKDDGIKAFAEGKKWATIDDALKSHKELETAFSGKLEALAPKTAAEYQFTKPKDIPEGVGYNDTFADSFKSWSHTQKLSNAQAAGLHDAFVKFATDSVTAQATQAHTAQMTAVVDAEKTLTKEWGSKDNPAFQRNVELARRASTQLGMDLKELGVVKTIGGVDTVVNSKVLMALTKVGSAMFSEDKAFGQQSSLASNPFDPKTLNLSAQGAVFTSDPAKAALLIDSLPQESRGRYAHIRAQLKAKGF